MDNKLTKLLKIQRLRRLKGCEYVFIRNGKRSKDFRGTWKKACKEAQLEGKLFHDFRCTGVRNMARAGIQQQVAMRISGHKTRTVFDRYNIVSPDDLRQAASKMNEFSKTTTKTTTIEEISEKGSKSDRPEHIEINKQLV